MSKIAIIPTGEAGKRLADTLQTTLSAVVITRQQVTESWNDFDAFVFIGAMGICVRTIAPVIDDKHTDPAVVCVDTMGKYVISVLSGHVGGANQLTHHIAELLGANPVITTHSDNAGLWALDTLARQFGWELVEDDDDIIF